MKVRQRKRVALKVNKGEQKVLSFVKPCWSRYKIVLNFSLNEEIRKDAQGCTTVNKIHLSSLWGCKR